VQSSADRGGFFLVKSFRGAGLGEHCEHVILGIALCLKKNDRKVLVIGMMHLSATEGGQWCSTACFAWKGSTPRLKFSAFKQHLSAPAALGCCISSERCSACGLRIG